ncbi:MAG: Gfo/Idh/MocA family oxidoreductase [Defluviitaleaceae bacterium]|nr:Gfo/Idh/MocA family oxidoreductase [Defluviitaleaceae bacterium]
MGKKIGFLGELKDTPLLRIGYVGCGSHSRRNILTTLGYVPVEKAAICDLNKEKPAVFAREFGFKAHYNSHLEMLENEKLDAVFIVSNYDKNARPVFCKIAEDCLNAGCHVWMEKPPAAEADELVRLKALAKQVNKQVAVGFKKMFFPANEKAKELMGGDIQLALFQYPQYIPTQEEFDAYMQMQPIWPVTGFLDHICHPISLMIYLMGYPRDLYYSRNAMGGGNATFTFHNGAVASLALTHGAANNGGMERTTLIGNDNQHIVVDNNIKLSLHRSPKDLPYGNSPSFYMGGPEDATAVWEPEFSLGQLYNNSFFLLGYYGEINEFCNAILEKRDISKGHLDDAIQITKIFCAFAEGANKRIALD